MDSEPSHPLSDMKALFWIEIRFSHYDINFLGKQKAVTVKSMKIGYKRERDCAKGKGEESKEL